VLCGGNRIDGPGFFYEPTALSDITPQMRVYSEEVFGPVAMLYRARDEDDALRIANDSPFGLAASVWTADPGERAHFIERLEVGMVFVNAMVASTPELPFGGLKQSGYGRELGDLGLREFCAVKTVWVA
jgi:succinate-semialdehyde dehydrogenase/glutarate-semialdehyde dehydrogenase